FFAFSDEPDWVRDNLNLPYDTRIVSHNGVETNYEDVRLMSRCRHHIIANSSFSWWGAWLNPDAGKIVITPSRWFADPDMQDHDLVPEDWVKL
ncbi:MAG: alpha-1,2-fucosyltransferase, partial [Alphaproteobacteria bacterium]|nr:alpha-1,2-fucosyltransferase [Alphaproteobacteria bacterium]